MNRPVSRPAALARRAFTLVELLIVIAIIALLVSILLPTLSRARRLAKRTVCASNLRSVNLAVMLYTDAHRDAYPAAEDPVSRSPFYWLWMGRGWRGFIEPYLGEDVSPDNPSVLLCPSDPAREEFQATSYAYSMSFYHSPGQIDAMDDKADTYSNAPPPVRQSSSDVRHPARKILIGEWTSNHQPVNDDAGWWCWQGRRNMLFADGSVVYVHARDIEPANDDWPDPNLTRGGIGGQDVSR
jgi:prepilin-type N-terminal cleavage/methylation domain-containing protein/prepilin-type processing-associated H-X9-DG protein